MAALAVGAVVAGAAGCNTGREGATVETRARALGGDFSVDPTGPIGQRWQEIGGMAVLGNPSSAVQDVPGLEVQYQTFASGVIVWSNDFGAVRLPRAIFDKWISLDTATLADVGAPTGDFVFFTPAVQTVVFERGQIFYEPTASSVFLAHGKIYLQTQLTSPIRHKMLDATTRPDGGEQRY